MGTPEAAVASYEFFSRLARIINSGQARSIIVSGNVNDLFFDGDSYVPLVPFLLCKTGVNGLTQVVYELNGPVRVNESDRKKLFLSESRVNSVELPNALAKLSAPLILILDCVLFRDCSLKQVPYLYDSLVSSGFHH